LSRRRGRDNCPNLFYNIKRKGCESVQLFLQQVFNGIMIGSTYAIVALGLTLVFGILHVPNFAHGHLYMLGAYVTFFMMKLYGLSFWPALLISMLVLALIGVLVERIVFRPLINQAHITMFISAIGLLMLIENFVIVAWGPRAHRIQNPYPTIVRVFGITMTHQRIIVIAAAVILMVLLQLFIKKTIVGTTIEAVAQDREGALMMGISVNRVAGMTFAISSALAAAAASLVAPIFMISPTMGGLLVMKAMIIIILGGMGSIKGAILGGYILGLVEALGGGYLSAAYKDVFAFGLLIAVLAVKPTGLFGKEK